MSFKRSIASLPWNSTFWLVVQFLVTSFKESECLNSGQLCFLVMLDWIYFWHRLKETSLKYYHQGNMSICTFFVLTTLLTLWCMPDGIVPLNNNIGIGKYLFWPIQYESNCLNSNKWYKDWVIRYLLKSSNLIKKEWVFQNTFGKTAAFRK